MRGRPLTSQDDAPNPTDAVAQGRQPRVQYGPQLLDLGVGVLALLEGREPVQPDLLGERFEPSRVRAVSRTRSDVASFARVDLTNCGVVGSPPA